VRTALARGVVRTVHTGSAQDGGEDVYPDRRSLGQPLGHGRRRPDPAPRPGRAAGRPRPHVPTDVGHLLAGVFIFGPAGVLNCSGRAASLADAFCKVGVACVLIAPILGWIGVMPGYRILIGFLFCHLMPQAMMP